MALRACPHRALAVVTVGTGPGVGESCPTSNTQFHPSIVYSIPKIPSANLLFQPHPPNTEDACFYSVLERHAKKTLLGRPMWHLCSALPDMTICSDVGGATLL
jgi:hypothetical protein